MKKLPDRVESKKAMGKLYWDKLAEIPGVERIDTDFAQTAPWFFDILCEDRQGLMAYLKEKNIGTREFYPALHKEPAYHYTSLSFPSAEDAAKRGLWLPSAVTLTDEEIDYVCEHIRMYYNRGLG